MSDTGYSIVYLRPDGWWCAGCVFDVEADAQEAADEHDWRGSEWAIVPLGDSRDQEAHPDGKCREDT